MNPTDDYDSYELWVWETEYRWYREVHCGALIMEELMEDTQCYDPSALFWECMTKMIRGLDNRHDKA